MSPTARNLLSTAAVDNRLFRPAPAAYGFPQLTCPGVKQRTCQCISLVFRTRIRLVLGRVSDGLGGSVQRICKE